MESTQPQRPNSSAKAYLEDSYLFTLKTKVSAIREGSDTRANIVFDATVFHPQGGGQPSDSGYFFVERLNTQIGVEKVSYDRDSDTVLHEVARDAASALQAGDDVILTVDEEKRRLYARLHSAGHLLDICVQRVGLPWTPGKGYHFPDGPYVEYVGAIDTAKSGDVIEQLNRAAQEVIAGAKAQDATIVKVYSYDEAKQRFEVPSAIPAGTPLRYVQLTQEDKGCPCGGTHVKHVTDIKGVEVTRITKKGKNVRVSYKIV